MTHKEFFDWLRKHQTNARLSSTSVDAANKLLLLMPASELQKCLSELNGWPISLTTLKISEDGLSLLKHFEGCKLKAYKDGGGVLTIGYGHTSKAGGLQVYPGLTITQSQAEQLLLDDLDRMTYPVIKRLVKVSLSQGQFDALCSFIYNLGEGQVSTSTLLKLLNTGDFSAAADQFKRWKYDNGKVELGLVRRRAAERELFES